MSQKKVYQELASAIGAIHNLKARFATAPNENDRHWLGVWNKRIDRLMREAPSGAGIDSGTMLETSASTDECLIFTCSFHHMNETGMYDSWTEHTIRVRGSLMGRPRIAISGRNRNDVKEYLHEVFDAWLNSEAPAVATDSAQEASDV